MQKTEPLSQFSVCGCALCYICLFPTMVLIALTIYYSIAFNLYIPTTCTVHSDLQTRIIKICGYYGCYFSNYYHYEVYFLTNENKSISTQTESVFNENLKPNDTFICYYQLNSPESGVTFYNHFKAPYFTCLILTCVIGGIPFLFCIISIIIFPFAIYFERNTLQRISTDIREREKELPENK